MTIYEKLLNVQANMSCPKGQYNSFAGFPYRSCEDILEAVKPALKNEHAVIMLSDETVLIGDRFYIKATATFSDTESGETLSNTAFAREPENKKGMDPSQVTGMASSYARKYALSGLLCLDDEKDADTMDNTPKVGTLGEASVAALEKEIARTFTSKKSLLSKYGAETLRDLSYDDYEDAMKKLKELPTVEKAVDALGGTKNQ